MLLFINVCACSGVINSNLSELGINVFTGAFDKKQEMTTEEKENVEFWYARDLQEQLGYTVKYFFF